MSRRMLLRSRFRESGPTSDKMSCSEPEPSEIEEDWRGLARLDGDLPREPRGSIGIPLRDVAIVQLSRDDCAVFEARLPRPGLGGAALCTFRSCRSSARR